jgi:ribosomal-protein-alanine N-acetyltransferase
MQLKYLFLPIVLLSHKILSFDFIFETARLKFRAFNNQDFNILYPLLSDPLVMAHSRDGFLDMEGTKIYLEKRIIKPFVKQGWGRYALFDKFNIEFVGFCGLTVHTLDDNQEYVELGYKIIRKFWNQGYATEAAIGVKDYAKDVLGIKEIISIIESSNLASIKVAQKVGLSFWKKSFFNNEIVDIYKAKFE